MTLAAKSLCFETKTHKKVLNGLQFKLTRGEKVCILGESGSGKTALMKICCGIQVPTSGSLHWQDLQLEKDTIGQWRRHTAMSFQHDALFHDFDVLQNISFGLRRRGVPTAQANKQARELLDRVGLRDAERQKIWQLSGGMQKRVGVARALALRPSLLICDEPTAGLDPPTSASLVELLLGELAPGTTVILSSQDPHVIRAFGKRVFFLKSGELLYDGVLPDENKDEKQSETVQRGADAVAAFLYPHTAMRQLS